MYILLSFCIMIEFFAAFGRVTVEYVQFFCAVIVYIIMYTFRSVHTIIT